MKKYLKNFCLCFMMLSLLVAGIQPVTAEAASIKMNKTISGSVQSSGYKKYYFEIKEKKKVEATITCKSKNAFSNSLSLSIYKVKKGENPILYPCMVGSSKNLMYSQQIKIKKTLSPGKYYVDVSNLGYFKMKYTLALKELLTVPTSIKLNCSKVSLRYHQTKQLKATDKTGTAIRHSSVQYASSNRKVATVSKTGKITAVNAGTCKITAKIKNGKKAVCKVTVPKLDLEEQLQQRKVYVQVDCINDHYFYNDCWVKIRNDTKKDISYMELQIAQYDNKWSKLESPFSHYYVNETLPKNKTESYCFYVNDDAKKARACIIKVHYADGTTWTNPLYRQWMNKYL